MLVGRRVSPKEEKKDAALALVCLNPIHCLAIVFAVLSFQFHLAKKLEGRKVILSVLCWPAETARGRSSH